MLYYTRSAQEVNIKLQLYRNFGKIVTLSTVLLCGIPKPIALEFDPYEICEALGVPDDINVPGGLINAYINYNLAARKPDADLDVVLSTEDECGEESVLYHLSEAEAAMLLPRMDAYCKSTRGRGLEEIAQSYAVNRDLEREKKSSHAAINPRKKPPEKRPER